MCRDILVVVGTAVELWAAIGCNRLSSGFSPEFRLPVVAFIVIGLQAAYRMASGELGKLVLPT
jgi:hypothetical protein